MTPLLLILAIFANLQGIRGALTIQPQQKQFCDYDAFISSQPINGKVFLHAYDNTMRQGDWYKARGFCAANCAEIVRIDSKAENDLFLAFMRSVDLKSPGVWLGAEVDNKVPFTNWSSGAPTLFDNKAAALYNNAGHNCVNANRELTTANKWYDDNCNTETFFIACQRPDTWKPCE